MPRQPLLLSTSPRKLTASHCALPPWAQFDAADFQSGVNSLRSYMWKVTICGFDDGADIRIASFGQKRSNITTTQKNHPKLIRFRKRTTRRTFLLGRTMLARKSACRPTGTTMASEIATSRAVPFRQWNPRVKMAGSNIYCRANRTVRSHRR